MLEICSLQGLSSLVLWNPRASGLPRHSVISGQILSLGSLLHPPSTCPLSDLPVTSRNHTYKWDASLPWGFPRGGGRGLAGGSGLLPSLRFLTDWIPESPSQGLNPCGTTPPPPQGAQVQGVTAGRQARPACVLAPPAGYSVYPALPPQEVLAKQARRGGCVGKGMESMEPARAADQPR